MSEENTFKVAFKKKGAAFRRNQRKVQESSSSDEDETRAIRTTKKTDMANKLIQRSSNYRKRKGVDIASDSDEDQLTVAFKSKRTTEREGPTDMGATSTIQTETEKDRDAQAIHERSLAIDKETRGKADDKIYRGMANYSKFYEKKDTVQGNAASVRKGPMRAPDHIRSTVRWDYQPDLCKDFKETGYCGFGDSCKFLHDRTDYKFGWQMEADTHKSGDGDEENYEIPSDEEHIPFKCLFCRQSFVDPVVTKCRHFFCEKCAIECFRKSKKCHVCGENTRGIFKPAKEISQRLQLPEEGEQSDSD